MSVTNSSFRASYPELSDPTRYLDSQITYWLAVAQIVLNIQGQNAPTVCALTGSIGLGGILTVSAISFGTLNLAQGPLLLAGQNMPANVTVLAQLTGAPGGIGTYQLNTTNLALSSTNLVAVQGNFSVSCNTRWGISSPTPDVPPTTIADWAISLYVAHNLVLEAQQLAQAAAGGIATGTPGVISSKSVGPASVSYDVAAGSQEGAGWYNLTIYGRRLWQMARYKGMGPIQVGIGMAPPFAGMGAWAGPWPWPAPGGSGFG